MNRKMKKQQPAERIRPIRDRDLGKPAVKALTPEERKAIRRALRIREQAKRDVKKLEAKEEQASKELEDLMKKHNLEEFKGNIKLDEEVYPARAYYFEGSTREIDYEKLKKLVKKSVLDKCMVFQIGLLEQHAGKIVVQRAARIITKPKILKVEVGKVPVTND